MIKSTPFANAATIVVLALYAVCRILSIIAPDLLFNIGRSWFHTFTMASMRTNVPLDGGIFLYGGVTIGLLTWVTVYATVEIYNRLLKK